MFRIIDNDPNRIGEWVAAKNAGIWKTDQMIGIGLERNGELVAGTMYENYLGRSICMHTAIDRLTRDFLWYSFYYPFIELKVNKVLGLVDSFNSRAIALDYHLGFRLEHSIKDASKDGDLLIFSMTREQCRWLSIARHLGVQNGKQRQQRSCHA